MNPTTRDEARRLSSDIKRGAVKIKNANIAVCPPFVFARDAMEIFDGGKILVCAQDIFWKESGAYTGEISGLMLKNLGVKLVLVGHSERRTLGETDDIVNKKVKSAIKLGLVPIICVGEKERDNHGYYLATVKKQIEHAFAGIPGTMLKNTVVAYEPIWAVGNVEFKTATPHDAVEMAIFIKKVLADRYGAERAHDIRILYGGSSNPQNAGGFLAEKEIAGLLIGRESLDAKKFLAITALC